MTESSQMNGFFEVSHTADKSLKIVGYSLEELFTNAAKGMYHLINVSSIKAPRKVYHLNLSEMDVESLLVSFLSELLFFLEKRIFIEDLEITIRGNNLKATLHGVPAISYAHEIKAVTFNNLKIIHDGTGFETTLVFDI